jgi:hypothetical protein
MKHSERLAVTIPKPCQQDWNDMIPYANGRFCQSCQHAVVDFTQWSDRQLLAYLVAAKGQRVCGRLAPHQVNRDFRLPDVPVSMAGRIAAKLTTAALFLQSVFISPEAKAAPEPRTEQGTPEQSEGRTEISGRVLDEQTGKPVSGIVVSIPGTQIFTSTDASGYFLIAVPYELHYRRVMLSARYNNATWDMLWAIDDVYVDPGTTVNPNGITMYRKAGTSLKSFIVDKRTQPDGLFGNMLGMIDLSVPVPYSLPSGYY